MGDMSQYVSSLCCKKLFYPFKQKRAQNVKPFRYCLSCWCKLSKKVNAVQMQDGSSCFMQQDTQIMSLHAHKRTILNNIIFERKINRKAKSLDHPRASIKITKYCTNKFIVLSAHFYVNKY